MRFGEKDGVNGKIRDVKNSMPFEVQKRMTQRDGSFSIQSELYLDCLADIFAKQVLEEWYVWNIQCIFMNLYLCVFTD